MKSFTKHIIIIFSLLAYFPFSSSAQNEFNKWGIGVGAGLFDYNGGLGNEILFQGSFGGSFHVNRYLGKHFDLSLAIYIAQLDKEKNKIESSIRYTSDFESSLFGANLGLKYKILSSDKKVVPFIFGGLGFVNYSSTGKYSSVSTNGGTTNTINSLSGDGTNLTIPVGGGITWNISPKFAFELSSIYHFTTTDDIDLAGNGDGNDDFLATQLGINLTIGGGGGGDSDNDGVKDSKDNCPGTPRGIPVDEKGCPKDSDNDGVADYIDQCPNIPGLPHLGGCPDKDGDGVIDQEDKCPDVPGKKYFDGCPDSDNDGVIDSEDECPDKAGLRQFNGCPDGDGDGISDQKDDCPDKPGIESLGGCPDTDGDGIRDIDDACPNKFGPKSNNGCPLTKEQEYQQAMNGISVNDLHFEFNSANIKPSGYKLLKKMLEKVMEIKNKNTTFVLVIDGHTDNVGSEKVNLRLSKRRAESVKKFFVKSGIDPKNVEVNAFGYSKPIADNKTAKGRALNRRVDIYIK